MSTQGIAIFQSMRELPKSPCEKNCSMRDECSAKLLACEPFYAYAMFGVSGVRASSDQPTRSLYELHLLDDATLYGYESKGAAKTTMRRKGVLA